MKYQFCSGFAHYIFNILKQRSVLGYTIDDYQNRLASFDQFCATNFKSETVLTQKIVFAWCNDAQGNGGANRACIMRADEGRTVPIQDPW